ncbi:hypothetical protein FOL46_007905, partial [Perkinsus olseni]
MKGFQLLVAVVIALVPAGGVLDKQAIDEAFEKFIRKYNKKYTSTEERAKRRGFFAATLAQVFAANQERLDILGNGSDYVAGINSFADFSTAEFEAKMLCGYNPSISESSSPRNQSIPYTLGHTESIRLPETVDWVAAGAVGPPRDQRTCGCCYAMQVATVAESHFQIRTGIHPMIPFSVQQLVDCSKSTGNKGCTSGSQRFAWTYVKSSGMVKESVYPFIAKDGKCKSSIVGSAANQCLAPGDIEGWFGVLPRSDDALMHKLAMYGPVPVSVHGSSARFRNYRFGVMTRIGRLSIAGVPHGEIRASVTSNETLKDILE